MAVGIAAGKGGGSGKKGTGRRAVNAPWGDGATGIIGMKREKSNNGRKLSESIAG